VPKPVELHEEASAELAAAVTWYAERNVRSAIRLASEALGLIEIVGQTPHSFPRYAYGTRRALMTSGFPYSLVFLELPERVYVVAFAHGRRRPGYWRDRI
jgi:toxin ParE1/3/4